MEDRKSRSLRHESSCFLGTMRRNVICREYAGGVENQKELRDSNKGLNRSLDRLKEGQGGKVGDVRACPW